MSKGAMRKAEFARLRDEEGMPQNVTAKVQGTSRVSVNSSYRNVAAKRNHPPKPNGHAIEVKDHERPLRFLI